MEKQKKLYLVQGNAKVFNDIVKRDVEEVTWATSEAKARSNIAFRIKKQLGLSADSKLSIDGSVTLL